MFAKFDPGFEAFRPLIFYRKNAQEFEGVGSIAMYNDNR